MIPVKKHEKFIIYNLETGGIYDNTLSSTVKQAKAKYKYATWSDWDDVKDYLWCQKVTLEINLN